MSTSTNGNRNIAVNHSNIIIVEGSSDKRVIEALLTDMGLNNSIDVREFSGIDKIHPQLLTVVNNARNKNPLSSINLLLIWDRDQPHNESSKTSKAKIRKELFQNPNKSLEHLDTLEADKFKSAPSHPSVLVSLYEMPGDGIEGEELEELWLHTLNKDSLDCIDAYFDCIKFKPEESKGKRYAHVYLAGREYFYSSIGSDRLSKKEDDLQAILQPSHAIYQPLKEHILAFFSPATDTPPTP
jgi:hypothetical protein